MGMKGLVLKADWQPRRDYNLSEFEKETKKAVTASSVWQHPRLTLEEMPKPQIGPHDVLLKIKACGICGTDVHLYETDEDGYVPYPGLARFPSVLGHEFSGVIDMTKIITKMYCLNEAMDAFKQAIKREDGKIMIKP